MDCSRIKEWKGLQTASMGFFQFDSLVEQCTKYRDELVQRMSSRELAAWFENTLDDVTSDWKHLFLNKQQQQRKCFPHSIEDTVNRMCTMNGCCSAIDTVGCPEEHYSCAQCEYLLELRRSVGQGQFGHSTMTKQRIKEHVDDAVVNDLQEVLNDRMSSIDEKIEELERKERQGYTWLKRFPQFVSEKDGLADLMGRMAPMLDGQCWRLRKQLNLEITRQAREEMESMKGLKIALEGSSTTFPTNCYPPKDVGKKRNWWNKLQGTPSCLRVYIDHIFMANLKTHFTDAQIELKKKLDSHIAEINEPFLTAGISKGDEESFELPKQKKVKAFGGELHESRQVCFELIDDVIDAMTVSGGQTLNEYLNSEKHGFIFGSHPSGKKQKINVHRVRNIVKGIAVKCCERVLIAWLNGETGDTVAANCDVETRKEKERAVEAILSEYNGKMMTDFVSAHHISEEEKMGSYRVDKKVVKPPTSAFTKEMLLSGGPKDVHNFANEMYDKSNTRMMEEIASIEQKLTALRRYKSLAEERARVAYQDKGKVHVDVFETKGRDRWNEMKKILPEKIRTFRSCLIKRRKASTKKRTGEEPAESLEAMNTKGFNAIGPEFFEWFEALNKHQWKAIPRTDRGLCGLLYPLCWDDSEAARIGRDSGCRDY